MKGQFSAQSREQQDAYRVNVSLPLYEGGEISARTKRAAAQAKANEYLVKDLEDQVVLDTESAFRCCKIVWMNCWRPNRR